MNLVYDEESPSYFQPNLTDEYLDELDRLFDRICQSPTDRESVIEAKISEVESRIPDHEPSPETDQRDEYIELQKYIAVLEVLHDLVEIGYFIEKDPDNIDGYPPVQVYPPDSERYSNNPDKYKEIEQRILEKERQAQFDANARKFIREMETPTRHKGASIDVTNLIADGEELAEDLRPLQSLDREEITRQLDQVVQPYIQVAEKGVTDLHTGLDLHDIWRYFRYTWRTPYNTVPGRNINFLVRDAAREYNPVMGIASIASSMMNLKRRDQFIGWRVDAVGDALPRKMQENMVEHQLPKEERTSEQQTVKRPVKEYLETEGEWKQRTQEHCQLIRAAVENAIEKSIEQVRYDDFIDRYDHLSEDDFVNATDTAFTCLKQLQGLATYVFKGHPPLVTEVENSDNYENIFDPEEYHLTESDLEDLDIEDTDPDSYERATLKDIGIKKAELEALVVAKASSPAFDEVDLEEWIAKLDKAYPESIQLEKFAAVPIDLEATELSEFGPVDFDDIDSATACLGAYVKFHLQSETALFIKKRATTLQKLLRDKEYFQENSDIDDDKEFVETALESKAGQRALRTALKETKKRRVGAGMMNIQVCGAIPPYNHILGGKLVAMALTGPEIIETYREKYDGYESKIASAMKGAPVIKENELVFLDTTGLFKVGSAQYDRVRVPTPNGRIEYEEIGTTSGYGSVQFGGETRSRLAKVTELLEDRKAVRGRFGEGVAPRMRKIRHGIENLGLNGDLLKHESPRVIYAVPLSDEFREYLFGLVDSPEYCWPMDDVEEEQQSIYDHWKHRWVSKRIQRDETLTNIKQFDRIEDLSVGHEIDFQDHSLRDFF